MSWAHEHAVQLLNDAKLTNDTSQKLLALQRLSELILTKEPALLHDFGGALLELQTAQAAGVRKFLATKLPEVATQSPPHAAACIATAAALIRDDDVGVAKRALLSAASLFQLALSHASTAAEGAGAVQPSYASSAWHAARTLLLEACDIARSGTSTGARVQAMKMAEAGALAASSAVPTAAVVSAELLECLRASLGALTALSRQDVDGTVAGMVTMAHVGALASVARQRPHLMPDVLPALLDAVTRAAAAVPSATTASVVHAIKTALLQLLRGDVKHDAVWQERIVAALATLGQQEAAESAMRRLERSAKRERALPERDAEPNGFDDDELPPLKRPCSEPPPPAANGAVDVAHVTEAGLLHQVASALAALAAGGDLATLKSFVAQLAPAVLADVVVLNMRHLPAEPPALSHVGADTTAPALATLFGSAAAPPAAPAPSAPTTAVIQTAAAPVVPLETAPPPLVAQQLGAEQRAAQRLAAAGRILRADASGTVTASGGDGLRCSLVARVGADAAPSFRGDLLDYLLEDYNGRKGHAYAVQWLYSVFAGELAPHTLQKPGYEAGLLTAARRIIRQLSARDRALPLLFVEAPTLPASALEMLEWLVGLAEPHDEDPTTLEQRTLGLITLRDIVMLRQLERGPCLAMVLRCTVHADDALRGKAIRMVVNQLHPLPYAASQIEEFAKERLQSVPLIEERAGEGATSTATSAADDALRRVSLYFALCTRNEALLPLLFSTYEQSNTAVQPAFNRNMAGLARSLGVQAITLLRLIESPPNGAIALALQAFHALCDSAEALPQVLVQVARSAYQATQQDIHFMLPVLHALPRDELRALLPHIVALPTEEVVAAFRRMLEVAADAQPALSAAELLVALHTLDATQPGVQLKMVMDACSAAFLPQLRDLFTPDALAVALQQMVEMVPLPLLFMRTVIQTATVAPKLHGFILDLLSTLVLKQVWKTDVKLWQGVLRCAKQLVPRSFPVYLQLPEAQLREALTQAPDLVAPLTMYASTPAVRTTVPGATVALLSEMAPAADA